MSFCGENGPGAYLGALLCGENTAIRVALTNRTGASMVEDILSAGGDIRPTASG